MDAFETLVGTLLRHQGYWVETSFKIELTKADKRAIEKSSSPRWEIDLVAYKPSTNELLAVECKSFLDSRGVVYRDGGFEPPERYKLFSFPKVRRLVVRRLVAQLVAAGRCRKSPKVKLCLAAGNIARVSDRAALERRCATQGWGLFTPEWILAGLEAAGRRDYENDVVTVVAKLIARTRAAEMPD